MSCHGLWDWQLLDATRGLLGLLSANCLFEVDDEVPGRKTLNTQALVLSASPCVLLWQCLARSEQSFDHVKSAETRRVGVRNNRNGFEGMGCVGVACMGHGTVMFCALFGGWFLFFVWLSGWVVTFMLARRSFSGCSLAAANFALFCWFVCFCLRAWRASWRCAFAELAGSLWVLRTFVQLVRCERWAMLTGFVISPLLPSGPPW